MGNTTPSQGLRYPYVDDIISESAQGNLGADIAAKLTTQDTARALVIQRPFVYLPGSSTSLADGVDTALSWSPAQFDSYGLWSGGSPTRITPGSGNTGLWKFALHVSLSAGVGIIRVQLSLAVTGTTRVYRTYFCTNNSTDYCLSGMQQIATGTDYMEFKVLHNGGGAQSVSNCVATAWQASA